jgi:hypothetical protein
MIREALNAFVLPKVWAHDRSQTIGASEIGQCARRIKYVKSNQPIDKTYVPRWGATERGNLFETHLWVPALRKRYGDKLKFAGEQQTTFIDGHLSATPDGILIGQPSSALRYLGVQSIGSSGCFMVECKTIDPRVNLTEAKHANVMQTHVQMGLVREQTKHKPNYALLSYANASFLDDVTEFAVKFDPDIYAQAKIRARSILETENAKDIRPEGWIEGGKECDHCPYAASCGIERHNLPSAKYADKPVDPQFKAEMVDMVRDANEVRAVLEGAKEKFREHQDMIKHRLREKNVRKIEGVVSWTDVKGRISYDNEAIRAWAIKKGLDIEKYSDVGDPTDRLVLSGIGGDDEVTLMHQKKAGKHG